MGSYPRRPYARLLDAGRLEDAIEATGLGIPTFAKAAGVGAAMIYFLVRGGRTSCTPEFATAIAEAAAVPFGDLFEVTTAIRKRRHDHRQETEINLT